MTKLLLTCGLLAALTACATSQPAPSAPTASTSSAAPDAGSAAAAPQVAAAPSKPKMICEDTARTDSHFQQRVCMTPEQMEARRKQAQADMQNYQNSGVCAQGGGGGSCGGGGGGPPR